MIFFFIKANLIFLNSNFKIKNWVYKKTGLLIVIQKVKSFLANLTSYKGTSSSPGCPTSRQMFASGLSKTVENGPSIQAPAMHMGDLVKLLALGFIL